MNEVYFVIFLWTYIYFYITYLEKYINYDEKNEGIFELKKK